MIFCCNKDCFSEYLLHMSLFTFAGEITMSKEMPIKNGDHYIPKPIIPIYTPNTNESAHFPKLSLTTDVIYLYHFDQLCFTYTFLNISETFFQMLNWPFAFSYLNTLPKYFFSCYKYCFSSLSSPFAIFLVCSTNQPPKRWSCTLQDGLREGRSVSEHAETGDKGSATEGNRTTHTTSSGWGAGGTQRGRKQPEQTSVPGASTKDHLDLLGFVKY